ncbi:MAG: dTDP-4-dehydrorhamnose reductase [Alistipes sp.]|nr:dTDP-4-dehydrorhamnose reductase [Alistipes sp.]
MLRVAIIGGRGQLGRAISEVAANSQNSYVAYDEHEANILDSESLSHALIGADVVINCAAYTNVEAAEDDVVMAQKVNADGVATLSKICSEQGARLIHISTDYVFGGDITRQTPYTEHDTVAPINIYGTSKAEGEAKALCNSDAVVIRTAWLYAPWSKNFCRTIYSLSATQSELRVVEDQRGTPTSALSLARFLVDIIDTGKLSAMRGIYHYTDSGECSWYDFACAIVELSGNDCRVLPCSSDERPTRAKRPHYSVLSKDHILSETRTTLRPWHDALVEVINRIKSEL